MEKIKVEFDFTGHYFNEWPKIQIYHGDIVILDSEIADRTTHVFDIVCPDISNIKIRHYGKRFGENNVFDTDSSGQQDRFIQINDIRFNEVSIGEKLMSQLLFNTEWSDHQKTNASEEFISLYSKFFCQGRLSFNGYIDLQFTTPIYNWLIIKKYKIEQIESSYFSNYSKNWHYEEDLRLINEIKGLMHLD